MKGLLTFINSCLHNVHNIWKSFILYALHLNSKKFCLVLDMNVTFIPLQYIWRSVWNLMKSSHPMQLANQPTNQVQHVTERGLPERGLTDWEYAVTQRYYYWYNMLIYVDLLRDRLVLEMSPVSAMPQLSPIMYTCELCKLQNVTIHVSLLINIHILQRPLLKVLTFYL